jgi:hypothetical protein
MLETEWDAVDKSIVRLQEAKDIKRELQEILEDHDKIVI